MHFRPTEVTDNAWPLKAALCRLAVCRGCRLVTSRRPPRSPSQEVHASRTRRGVIGHACQAH